MSIKVCKFGGTSLADATQIRKVQTIIQSDPQRRYVVPSAPGKRTKDDKKITDLLYLCHAQAQQGIGFDEVWKIIADRYLQIASELQVKLDLRPALDQSRQTIQSTAAAGQTADFAASRGEYLNGLIVASLLNYEFIDAAEVIFFDPHGRFDDEKTQQVLSAKLAKTPKAVIPGFYGSVTGSKAVKTFSRGGSDITGAIVARGAAAAVYENWTDVNGLLMADPRLIPNPKNIDIITYQELRELAYMGATVLHDEAIFPVRKAGIPINIRNTNEPQHPGTMIVKDAAPVAHKGGITGIAGRKDFTVIALAKAMMNSEIGFGRKLLSVLEDHKISYEHTPSGIDTMSVVVADSTLEGKKEAVLADIRSRCQPDSLEVEPGMALIATVGRGMAQTPGTAARLFAALAKAGVNIRMIDQGSSEINIIVGVATTDFEKAMQSIYHEFVS